MQRQIRFSDRLFQDEAEFPIPELGDGVLFRMRVRRAVGLSDWYGDHVDELSNEKGSRELRLAFVREHVLGWSGLTTVEGTPVEFSEKTLDILAEDPDMFAAIFGALLRGTKTILEADEGNSVSQSADA